MAPQAGRLAREVLNDGVEALIGDRRGTPSTRGASDRPCAVLADRGFGDQALFAALRDLGFQFVVRFRGNVTVESRTGETHPAPEWVPATGTIRHLRGERVTPGSHASTWWSACRRAGCKPPEGLTHWRNGMMKRRTAMAKTKVALTLDAGLVEQVDELVQNRRFRSRSQAVEAALADKLRRLARTRLAIESAKLNATEEKRLADEGLGEDLGAWPEY